MDGINGSEVGVVNSNYVILLGPLAEEVSTGIHG